jgi:hypothetical protein
MSQLEQVELEQATKLAATQVAIQSSTQSHLSAVASGQLTQPMVVLVVLVAVLVEWETILAVLDKLVKDTQEETRLLAHLPTDPTAVAVELVR